MATRTKPLISAAALASAAAIAVSSPAIAPSLSLPTPHALSAAKVQLTTFADVLSVPAVAWTDILFSNTAWGGVLTAENYGPEWAAPADAFGQYAYVNPWVAYCDGTCESSGIPGVAYLFFDALINGNGQGYNDSENWRTGAVNYLFEPDSFFQIGGGTSPTIQFVDNGFSALTWYALQGTIGQLVPAASVPLASLFWGPLNLTVAYDLVLETIAAIASAVPLIGPITGNSILAYLGDKLIEGTEDYYQFGLSGVLNYWVDIATGAVPFPTASTTTLAGAAVPAIAAATVTETTPAADVLASTPAAEAPESTPAVDAPENTPAAEVVESTPAAEAPESTPAEEAPESTPAAEVVESTPAVDVPESTPAVETPAEPAVDIPAAEVADSAPEAAPAAPKRPIRDAVEKVGQQINSAVANAKAAKADRVAARKAKASAE